MRIKNCGLAGIAGGGKSGDQAAARMVGELRREGEQTRRAFKEYADSVIAENKKLREDIARNAQRNRTAQ
jgi:hypothetical protein